MKIGFLNNQLDNRGTGNAMFDYAHYNEELLGNQSVIFTYQQGAHDPLAIERYQRRFGQIYIPDDLSEIDALYHIKSGRNDGAFRTYSPYLVHSVFDNQPHGNVYATVSAWLGREYNLPYVPHIINLPRDANNLRGYLGIPPEAIVFGRHGGFDTFDITWAWGAITRLCEERDDVWFLFMNTAMPEGKLSPHIKIIDPTAYPAQKAIFIETCDAMIHARARGETFGMAVGEFAFLHKPVITFSGSPERAHIEELGEHGIYYDSVDTLYNALNDFVPTGDFPQLYANYSPENVMAKFKEVFLDGI